MDSIAYQSCKARKKSTACASTPVPRKAPHPAHIATRMCPKNTHKSTCAGSGPMRTALCCFHGAHRNTMRGSYTGAGIHGHWPAPKPSRIHPDHTRLHVHCDKHGKAAWVRKPRAPIGGVCAHTRTPPRPQQLFNSLKLRERLVPSLSPINQRTMPTLCHQHHNDPATQPRDGCEQLARGMICAMVCTARSARTAST